MPIILGMISAALVLSFAANAHLWLRVRRNKKNPEYTVDAKELLHDITSTGAVIHIARVDPRDILIRSPRHGA